MRNTTILVLTPEELQLVYNVLKTCEGVFQWDPNIDDSAKLQGLCIQALNILERAEDNGALYSNTDETNIDEGEDVDADELVHSVINVLRRYNTYMSADSMRYYILDTRPSTKSSLAALRKAEAMGAAKSRVFNDGGDEGYLMFIATGI